MRLGFILLASLPVIAYTFKFSILYRHGIFVGEDWDYFAQNYEAARQSILHYHQFPWWNPWSNGGQPLFANPQFGLFSVPMPLVLIFGTVVGLHFSILAYYLLGFWGMYLLLRRIGCDSRLMRVMLAYIWVFSGFSAWHLGGGHLSFAVYLLTPLALLTLLNIHKKNGWIWFALTASLIIQTAMHYISVEIIFICVLVASMQLGRLLYAKRSKELRRILPYLLPYIYASIAILVLCGLKLLYTLQFMNDYPRLQPLDPPVSLKLFTAALTFRHEANPGDLTVFTDTSFGWAEFGNYMGLITLGLFFYLVMRKLENYKKFIFKDWAILVSILLAALISLGAFWKFSPFNILHHFPIFDQMRVPSRFICWVGLGLILFLASLPRKTIIYVLLGISTLDVFGANHIVLNKPQKPYVQAVQLSNKFEQYAFYNTDPSLGQLGIIAVGDLRLLRATQSNYGEIYGYEPILNIGQFYYLPGTPRCGIKQGCHFVLTNNATVSYWSPQHITLTRTRPGPIKLNMNPGKVWQVNNKPVFGNYRVLELQKEFIIQDTSQTINVTFRPTIR
jgi:hypothetical protein